MVVSGFSRGSDHFRPLRTSYDRYISRYMASIQKLPHSPNWIAYYRDPRGKQHAKSTGLPATAAYRVRALRVAEALEAATKEAKAVARLQKLVDSLAQEMGLEPRKSFTVRAFLKSWLDGKRVTVSPGSHSTYGFVVGNFLSWLGADADKDLNTVTLDRMRSYRSFLAEGRTASTANTNLRFLRMAFRFACAEGIIETNPLERLEPVKKKAAAGRRPFTWEELRRVVAQADTEWRGMIIFGLYTGQRLGDIAGLTVGNLDLTGDGGRGLLMLQTRKTARRQIIPLHPLARKYLEELNLDSNPSTPLFPRAHGYSETGRRRNLSSCFADLLIATGLRGRPPRGARRTGRVQVIARHYGVQTNTLKSWVDRGKKAGEECPLENPRLLLQWWGRRMKRSPVPGLVAASQLHTGTLPDLPAVILKQGGGGMSRTVEPLSFHSLRHTATSLMKSAGVAVSVVMDLVGHDDEMVSRVYTHTDPEERRRAIESMPSL